MMVTKGLFKMEREDYLTALRNNDCKVVFTKVDGTERTMLCTLRENVIKPLFEGKETKTVVQRTNKNITVYDLEKNAFRQFKIDSVKSFEIVE